ncbi:MAG: D-glycero-beta-D-manno-heptose 1,7-bisphosphate 7-phosphatase [Gammaproteobacteria bacterium]
MNLIILDRDGVINHDSPHFIKSPDEWIPIPGSMEAIAALKKAGFAVAVCTNQSGVGRGYYDEAMLALIHAKMIAELDSYGYAFDAIVYCPHLPEAGCDCRKPKPGMVHALLKQFDVVASDTWVVGDSFRDLEAGIAAGCKTLLVKTGNGEKTLLKHGDALGHTVVCADLASAVALIALKCKSFTAL